MTVVMHGRLRRLEEEKFFLMTENMTLRADKAISYLTAEDCALPLKAKKNKNSGRSKKVYVFEENEEKRIRLFDLIRSMRIKKILFINLSSISVDKTGGELLMMKANFPTIVYGIEKGGFFDFLENHQLFGAKNIAFVNCPLPEIGNNEQEERFKKAVRDCLNAIGSWEKLSE